jgi:hypothetical protein
VSALGDCREIEFKMIPDPAGELAVIEGASDVPFAIQRVYYLYDVPEGARRGGHAHRALRQVLIAVSGSFEVVLDDGYARRTVPLAAPQIGLYMPMMVWRELINFSAGAVCLVLTSERYDEADYIRDYDEFKRLSAA